MKFKTLAMLVSFLAMVGVASAQSTIDQGKAFKVSADHTGVNASEFRLYRDGAIVDTKPVSALVGGVVTFDVAGTLAPGLYSFEMSAFGPGGESAKVGPVKLTVKALPPVPPTNLRFVIAVSVGADGTLTFKAVPAADGQ